MDLPALSPGTNQHCPPSSRCAYLKQLSWPNGNTPGTSHNSNGTCMNAPRSRVHIRLWHAQPESFLTGIKQVTPSMPAMILTIKQVQSCFSTQHLVVQVWLFRATNTDDANHIPMACKWAGEGWCPGPHWQSRLSCLPTPPKPQPLECIYQAAILTVTLWAVDSRCNACQLLFGLRHRSVVCYSCT